MPDDLTALSDEALADELLRGDDINAPCADELIEEAARRLTRTCRWTHYITMSDTACGHLSVERDDRALTFTYCAFCGGRLVEERSDEG